MKLLFKENANVFQVMQEWEISVKLNALLIKLLLVVYALNVLLTLFMMPQFRPVFVLKTFT